MAAVHTKLHRHRSRGNGRLTGKRGSPSDKGSLDMSRTWEDQIHYESHGWGSSSARNNSFDCVDTSATTTTAISSSAIPRETNYNRTGSVDMLDSTFGSPRMHHASGTSIFATPRNNKYPAHNRSVSCTSHTSIATSSSGPRSGTFVHPFQQTPRTSSPPLYITPVSPLDNSHFPHDYSPTIEENVNKLYPPSPSSFAFRSSSVDARNSLEHSPTYHNMRISPTTLTPTYSPTYSDPHTSPTRESLCSPSSTGPLKSLSPTSATQVMSPKRSSLDMTFRLRSRSEVDTFTQREQIREARRKFDEKQRVKEEKYALVELEKKEREATKEAVKFEKAQLKKACSNGSSGRNSHEQAAIRRGTGGSNDTEKVSDLRFAANNYNNITPGVAPTDDIEDAGADVNQSSGRMYSAKKRTQSTWTAFILWVRTRLFKMGRR
ncbi:hypothetical protein Cpir12675_005523 [Ceratocystis pirilliformis]|uniref:Uncharacterized protein n=1 Tax=Ceratocystis pirilliformis TaxID=259994 RepID=A0ABR3YP30_9PEZI